MAIDPLMYKDIIAWDSIDRDLMYFSNKQSRLQYRSESEVYQGITLGGSC